MRINPRCVKPFPSVQQAMGLVSSQLKEDEDELSHAGSEEASMLSEFADDAHGEGVGIVGEKSCEDYSKMR